MFRLFFGICCILLFMVLFLEVCLFWFEICVRLSVILFVLFFAKIRANGPWSYGPILSESSQSALSNSLFPKRHSLKKTKTERSYMLQGDQ